MKIYTDIFGDIISLENLFLAWDEFKKGKQQKADVQQFEWKLEENIFKLHRDLKAKRYRHGAYSSFYIQDPKQRHIHKATVRDRILHHAIFAKLNPLFEPSFIENSFSCRIGRGTHKGFSKLENLLAKVSKNNHQPCFVLKCDIRKFFENIDHEILLDIVGKRIKDKDVFNLLKEVVGSFVSGQSNLFERKGLPIGNLTSQLFANVYLNEFDQFVKHDLKIRNYCRYTDDFLVVSDSKNYLLDTLPKLNSFLLNKLHLNLHPNKITIRKFHQGIDFLGYVALPHYQILRSKTKKRIFKKLKKGVVEYQTGIVTEQTLDQSLQSYLGVLGHADAYRITQDLKNQFWFWLNEK